jgi:hypothetical protein
MSELTPEARLRLERYLTRMRSALRGSAAVETTEIEQNVREHVEVAFAEAADPVDADRLDSVLAQLGPPDQWLSEDEQPWWRRIAARVANGPEDWRLAYLTFGSFALGLLLIPVGIGLVLLVAAFLLARANCELILSRGERLGARRWLVLPPIWLVALAVAGIALIPPVIGLASLGISDGRIHLLQGISHTPPESAERVRVETGYIAAVAGAWWLFLSAFFALLLKPFRAFFLPVTENLGRKHVLLLALVGAMVGAIGAVLLFASV